MQRFSFFLLCVMCANAANSAYLPTVDVSRGGVSARAAFGEEIMPPAQPTVERVARSSQKNDKKVVARTAKKSLRKKIVRQMMFCDQIVHVPTCGHAVVMRRCVCHAPMKSR